MMDVACVMCTPRLYFDAGAISLDTGSLRSGLVRSSAIDLILLSRENCLHVHTLQVSRSGVGQLWTTAISFFGNEWRWRGDGCARVGVLGAGRWAGSG